MPPRASDRNVHVQKHRCRPSWEAPQPSPPRGPRQRRPRPARPPACPPAPYRTPRPRRAAAASLRAALRSVSALRGLGPPSSSAASSAAALSAGPPRAAAGARPGAPRASASSRLAAPSGAGAPAACRGLGSAPQARGALPSRGRLDHRAAAARCRAPRPHASGRPRPAGPRPLGLRLQRSASSAPATRAAGEEARRRGRGREHARGGRKERAHGRLARREASPAVVRASVCTTGGAAGGLLRGESGEPSCCPGPCTSAVLSVPASCEGAKIPEPQQEKRPRQRLLSFLPLLTPESCQCTRDGRGRGRQSGDLDPCSLADLGLENSRRFIFWN